MLKVVIFDLDGTLYNYELYHIEAMKNVEKFVENEFKLDAIKFREIFEETKKEIKIKLGKNLASSHNRIIYFKQFLQKINENPFIYANQLYDIYWNTILNNMKLNDKVLEVFNFLKSKQIKIAICTNLTTNIQIRKIKSLKLENCIDYLITSEELGVEKPNKDMFFNILEHFKIEAKEAVFIGDNYNCDIIGAQNVGILGILIGNNKDCISVDNYEELLKKLITLI